MTKLFTNPKNYPGVPILFQAYTTPMTNGGSLSLVQQASFTIPADTLGPRGYIRWEALLSNDSNDMRTFFVKISDGSTIINASQVGATSSTSKRFMQQWQNNNATNSQRFGPIGTVAGMGYDSTTTGVASSSLDTTNVLTVSLHTDSALTSGSPILTWEYAYFWVCNMT